MSSIERPPAVGLGPSRVSARRRRSERVTNVLLPGAVAVALIPLGIIIFFLIKNGFSNLSLGFLTKSPPFDQSARGGGYWTGIKGTLKLIVMSTILAVPLGIGTAIYLDEYGRGSRFAGTVRFVSDLIAGVPSIFMGVFIFALLVEGHGYAAWKGAVALAILMLPIIARTSEEVLKLVPGDLRAASLALGVPRWRTVTGVILPAASSGLVTGVMLAVARAAGETAPLLFTSFGSNFVTGWTQVGGPDAALPLLIFSDAGSAYDSARQRAWAGALVLIALVLALTILARLIASRGAKVERV